MIQDKRCTKVRYLFSFSRVAFLEDKLKLSAKHKRENIYWIKTTLKSDSPRIIRDPCKISNHTGANQSELFFSPTCLRSVEFWFASVVAKYHNPSCFGHCTLWYLGKSLNIFHNDWLGNMSFQESNLSGVVFTEHHADQSCSTNLNKIQCQWLSYPSASFSLSPVLRWQNDYPRRFTGRFTIALRTPISQDNYDRNSKSENCKAGHTRACFGCENLLAVCLCTPGARGSRQ